jgi:hypothetical protein
VHKNNPYTMPPEPGSQSEYLLDIIGQDDAVTLGKIKSDDPNLSEIKDLIEDNKKKLILYLKWFIGTDEQSPQVLKNVAKKLSVDTLSESSEDFRDRLMRFCHPEAKRSTVGVSLIDTLLAIFVAQLKKFDRSVDGLDWEYREVNTVHTDVQELLKIVRRDLAALIQAKEDRLKTPKGADDLSVKHVVKKMRELFKQNEGDLITNMRSHITGIPLVTRKKRIRANDDVLETAEES